MAYGTYPVLALPHFKAMRERECPESLVRRIELGGQKGYPGSRRPLQMIDFHRVRIIKTVLEVHMDAKFTLGQRGLDYVRAHLHQYQPRRPRLWTPLGDFGKASNLLQQLQHSDFGGHKLFLKQRPAGHVPSELSLARFSAAKAPRRVRDRRSSDLRQGHLVTTDSYARKCRLAPLAGFG
jgi:hypothetical protein